MLPKLLTELTIGVYLKKNLINRYIPITIWYGSQLYRVRWGDFLSDGFKVRMVLRKEEFFLRGFFNVYIDDLSIALSNSKYGCTFGGCSVNNLSHADDMVILSPSETALQKLLDICSVYSEKHDIVYNVKKSVCMVINSTKYKITNLPRVDLAGVLLEYVERYKYVGMIIHVRNYDYDMTRQLRSIILRTNVLLGTFSRSSIKDKLHLFQSYCTNLYCSHLWHIYTKTQLNKLRITYNNALRRLFNRHPRCSASAMFANSNMPSLDEIRRKYMYRSLQRLNRTDNSILLCFIPSTNMLTSSIWRQWYRCLYV